MSRPRSSTIGSLGRAPARASKQPATAPVPPPPSPPRDVGALRRWIHSALFDNLGLKFLSMVLAVTVFLLVNTDRDREVTLRVGVSYMLPDDKVLVTKDRLEEVIVTVKGSWRQLRRLRDRDVERVNLDLRRAPAGEFMITPDMIHVPAGLVIESINPRSVRVAFDRRVEKVVELTAQVAGHAQHGYHVLDAKASPATVRIRGAEGAAMSSVRTREVSVEGRTSSFDAETEIVPTDGIEIVGRSQVSVHVTIDKELVSVELPAVALTVRGDGVDPARWSIAPTQVELALTGAVLEVEKAKAAVTPVVKLLPTDSKAHEVEVTIEGLPPGVGVRISPERVKVSPVSPKSP